MFVQTINLEEKYWFSYAEHFFSYSKSKKELEPVLVAFCLPSISTVFPRMSLICFRLGLILGTVQLQYSWLKILLDTSQVPRGLLDQLLWANMVNARCFNVSCILLF